MIKFKEYVREGEEVKVAAVIKEGKDFDAAATRREINENLSKILKEGFINPYMGWIRVRRLFEMYHVELPKVIFRDLMEDEEFVVLHSKESDYYLHFGYSFNVEAGDKYDVNASLLTTENLNELISMDDNNE